MKRVIPYVLFVPCIISLVWGIYDATIYERHGEALALGLTMLFVILFAISTMAVTYVANECSKYANKLIEISTILRIKEMEEQ